MEIIDHEQDLKQPIEPAAVYRSQVLRMVNRLLSWQDREPFSKSYGCFDRTYWGWKFTDFAGARFQEGVCALAFLFCRDFKGNGFTHNERILQWALAGMRFWQGLQNGDGSFDEAYPLERSLAATAFTAFYVGDAFLLLKDHIQENKRTKLCQTFERAGDWLCRNDEHHGILSNHLAAAAAALNVIYRICGESKYQKRSQYFLQKIYDYQSTEGWYEEYGGADPGYQTHATFYLGYIWKYTQDAALLKSLGCSVEFLKYFIHPNGTLGGEYGSRNTEFYFPAGFEILGPMLPDAAMIARFMRPSVAKDKSAGLSAMDAYNLLPMLNNYLFAADNALNPGPANGELPCQRTNEKHFPDAGLLVKSTPTYYSVLGLSKGGVLKTYSRKTKALLASDCGYLAETGAGRISSNQSLKRPGQGTIENEKVTIDVDFVKVNQRLQSPILFMGFRLFMLTLGRFKAGSFWIKNLMVYLLVRRRQSVPLHLVRRIRFLDDRINIFDQIKLTGNLNLGTLRHGSKFATIHMGSSRYFQDQELDEKLFEDEDWSEKLMRNRSVSIEREFIVSGSDNGENP